MHSYINYDIYYAALAMIDESEARGDTSDLEERAIYLLASACSTCKKLDQRIRELNSYPAQSNFSPVYIELEEEFPLCDVLVPPVATYLASMMVADENPSLSQKLYDQYCDLIATIGAECSCSAIEDVYFND